MSKRAKVRKNMLVINIKLYNEEVYQHLIIPQLKKRN